MRLPVHFAPALLLRCRSICYPFWNMRALLFAALFLISTLPSVGQNTDDSKPVLPKDPRAVFAAAAPFYDFSDPSLKPWHLKASYQLYDDKGKPSEQGTYEYWWASPKVYRSSWTRAGATHTDWHTADGKLASETSGGGVKFFEYNLQAALFAPLPDTGDLDPTKFRLSRESIQFGESKIPCIMVIPIMPQHGQIETVPMGLFPTYCFDSGVPVLRVSYAFGSVTTAYDHLVKIQSKFLPKEVAFFEGKRMILTANVDQITDLNPANPALTPPSTATVSKADRVPVEGAVISGFLAKKQTPIYPQDAKDARVSGKVVLRAIIGTDGGIHELHVVSTPWPSLASSALWAVSHWEYKPYLLNGEPVEVETTINVIYSLGN
jgi:TonB family protein